ncbi:MAG TPA: hypothetical protein VK501_28175 [Baekduia sp.]|uniref:hypothetical protein n=1 Tax=Baekduia sp. TaxID=2600305 RepID=UPI002BBC0A42|nr:hypothetical protein [Baekduia sp.]HMJ37818.1 hypothetical protein [Baekduia sp.]
MAVDPQLLAQALRTPESQDVTETPIARAVILTEPANVVDLVPALERGDTLESRNARRILCQFGPDAVPHLLGALAATASADARAEGVAVLWALLSVEEPHVVRAQLRDAWPAVGALLRDPSRLPDTVPEYVERDFTGRVCDLAYVVVEELLDHRFDQTSFRVLDDGGRDRAIRELLSGGLGSPPVA